MNSDYFAYWDIEDQYEMCDDEKKEIRMTDEEYAESCPECGEPLIEKWNGVKCSKCDYWFCY